MPTHKFFLVAAFLAFISVLSFGIEKPYLTPEELNLPLFLSPPPADDSPLTHQELTELLALQTLRTPEQTAFALADQQRTVFRYADTLGPGFTPAKLPVTAKFFAKVVEDAESLILQSKAYYHRPHPLVLDPRITPVLPKSDNGSYPSSHSTVGYLFSTILSAMVPEKSKELFARGDVFAENRLIGGVHYRTDVVAGRICAALIADRFFANADFQADFQSSRNELRQSLGLGN